MFFANGFVTDGPVKPRESNRKNMAFLRVAAIALKLKTRMFFVSKTDHSSKRTTGLR